MRAVFPVSGHRACRTERHMVAPSSITLSLILTSFRSSLMSFTFHLHSFLVVAPPVGNVAAAAAMDTVIAVHVDGNLPSFRCATQPRQPSHGELLSVLRYVLSSIVPYGSKSRLRRPTLAMMSMAPQPAPGPKPAAPLPGTHANVRLR